MKQILTLSLFCLGILLFFVSFSLLSKRKLQESFLTGFVDLNYTPPDNSLSDQQQTYVNVNILKQAVITMNDQIEQMTSDISDLQDQVTTLTNQQSDLVSSSTPDVEGTEM
jgi:TolA-binding protein